MSIEPAAWVSDDAPYPRPPPARPLSLAPTAPLRGGLTSPPRGRDGGHGARSHAVDFFGDATLDPTDLSKVTPAAVLDAVGDPLLCARRSPCLAGAGGLPGPASGAGHGPGSRRTSPRAASGSSSSELTVVKFGVLFNPAPRMMMLLVFWSIGRVVRDVVRAASSSRAGWSGRSACC